ncbi:MAG: S1C family serine protease [Candidatus Hinthialibacter antarcticus]|nr:S1C family serine protease [Candidatus Hinthialibacter antarcticus]
MMNRWLFVLCATWLVLNGAVNAQFDSAVYETFNRNAPAVYSIEVQVPKNLILQEYDKSISRLREFHDRYSDMVMSGTQPMASFFTLNSLIGRWERQLDFLKEQMLMNNSMRGTGFAIDPHHIVTLSSVVKSATMGGEITVTDHQKIQHRALLQGVDRLTGVAVLRIPDATFEHYVDLGRLSTTLPVSSYIMTIQCPYDLPPSPYTGMIGGYHRQLKKFELERYIQTNLPLYPGNEGAPVLSPSGQLVGMMAAEFSIGAAPGVSFAIPADFVAESANQIIQKGDLVHGWLPGIELQQSAQGILIRNVDPNSHAANSGLKPGDVIIGFDGRQETELWDLLSRIVNANPEQFVRVEILRGPNRMQFQIQLLQRR